MSALRHEKDPLRLDEIKRQKEDELLSLWGKAAQDVKQLEHSCCLEKQDHEKLSELLDLKDRKMSRIRTL